MSETAESGAQLRGKELIEDATGAEGRYIPYSGGSLGWFENSGILKCERGNDYKFHTAVDATKIRQKLFERWGADVNRRLDPRLEVTKETAVRIKSASSSYEVETKDLSNHGLRAQLLEDPGYEKGEEVTVQVYRDTAYKKKVMDLSAEVMWVARVGKRRLVWNLGISFTNIDEETSAKLKAFVLE